MLTWKDRFIEALELICKDKPPARMIDDWISQRSNDLQDWVGETSAPWWCQNIGVIDAATAMANAAVEGEHTRIDYTDPDWPI